MLNHTIAILGTICQNLPIGTNLAMVYFLWMMISGALLPNRGAIMPALKSIGLSDVETRRSWAAFGSGVWSIYELCSAFGNYVRKQPEWKERRYEGYLPIPFDITAYYRPTHQDCPGVHFHPAAQRALPAINIGLIGEVGELNGQRLALLRRIERAHGTEVSEPLLWKTLLPRVAHPRHGIVAGCSWGDATLHAPRGFVVEYGRVHPAHFGAQSLSRTKPRDARTDYSLVRNGCACLEFGPNTV